MCFRGRTIPRDCILARGSVGGSWGVGFIFVRRGIIKVLAVLVFSRISTSKLLLLSRTDPVLTIFLRQTDLSLRVRQFAPHHLVKLIEFARRSTIMLPPIACNTTIDCRHPCIRPSTCGHPSMPHACHENENCPPCPFLMTKSCQCGKKGVGNVRCSSKNVSCGIACGK